MKRTSQVIAAVGLLFSIGAFAQMVGDGMISSEGAWGVIIAAIPLTLAILGLRSAASDRPAAMWSVAGALGLFIIITAFSVGPYFWATTVSAFLAALLLQLARTGKDRATRQSSEGEHG